MLQCYFRFLITTLYMAGSYLTSMNLRSFDPSTWKSLNLSIVTINMLLISSSMLIAFHQAYAVVDRSLFSFFCGPFLNFFYFYCCWFSCSIHRNFCIIKASFLAQFVTLSIVVKGVLKNVKCRLIRNQKNTTINLLLFPYESKTPHFCCNCFPIFSLLLSLPEC